MDTKKREPVGEFKNTGRQGAPIGQPPEVNVHDLPGDAVRVALPYGIYHPAANTGWVNVGTDHDTAAFTVESIRRCTVAAPRVAIGTDVHQPRGGTVQGDARNVTVVGD